MWGLFVSAPLDVGSSLRPTGSLLQCAETSLVAACRLRLSDPEACRIFTPPTRDEPASPALEGRFF